MAENELIKNMWLFVARFNSHSQFILSHFILLNRKIIIGKISKGKL